MSILNVSIAKIKDESAFAQYVSQAAAIMADFDVQLVARGTFVEAISGCSASSSVSAVFRYPNIEVAKAFFASERYEAIVPLRERACDMTITLFEEDER